MPSRFAPPTETGSPCTLGNIFVTAIASSACLGVIGRMLTTRGPENLPEGEDEHCTEVLYMGTLLPASTCLTGTPASRSASSNENEQPSRKPLQSCFSPPVSGALAACDEDDEEDDDELASSSVSALVGPHAAAPRAAEG